MIFPPLIELAEIVLMNMNEVNAGNKGKLNVCFFG